VPPLRTSAESSSALAAAAALCVLGLENKVQAILLIGALPLVILPFGSADSPSVSFWRNPRSSLMAGGLAAIAALAAAIAAWPLIATGFDRALLDAAHFHPLVQGRFGIYQAALMVLIGGCVIAYAAIWRISLTETLASMFASGRGWVDCPARAPSRIQRQQCDRRIQSAGKDADVRRCVHLRGRERIQPGGNSVAAARWARVGYRALHVRCCTPPLARPCS